MIAPIIITIILFFLLLTIILYGLAKSVISMSFSSINLEKEIEVKNIAKTISWSMYVPQMLMLLVLE